MYCRVMTYFTMAYNICKGVLFTIIIIIQSRTQAIRLALFGVNVHVVQ
jgi:hypothetical protein